MRSIVITRLFTFFYPLRLAFKSLSIHQLNDISTAGVPFPDKAPKRRLKIKKYICVYRMLRVVFWYTRFCTVGLNLNITSTQKVSY